MSYLRAISGLSAILILSAISIGCGSTESPQAKKETANLNTYFKSLASHTPERMTSMLKAAASGSDAYLYAKHQIALALADEGTNQGTAAEDVTVEHDKVVLGNTPKQKKDESGARTEVPDVYSRFRFDKSGKIVTWSADPGGPLAGRPMAVRGSVRSGAVSVSLISAYRTNSGDFAITYQVKNSGPAKVSITTSSYINPNGRQVSAATPQGVLESAPHTFTDSYASVTHGKPGGSLLVGFDYLTQKRLDVR